MSAFVTVYRERPAFVMIWLRGRTNQAIQEYGRATTARSRTTCTTSPPTSALGHRRGHRADRRASRSRWATGCSSSPSRTTWTATRWCSTRRSRCVTTYLELYATPGRARRRARRATRMTVHDGRRRARSWSPPAAGRPPRASSSAPRATSAPASASTSRSPRPAPYFAATRRRARRRRRPRRPARRRRPRADLRARPAPRRLRPTPTASRPSCTPTPRSAPRCRPCSTSCRCIHYQQLLLGGPVRVAPYATFGTRRARRPRPRRARRPARRR